MPTFFIGALTALSLVLGFARGGVWVALASGVLTFVLASVLVAILEDRNA